MIISTTKSDALLKRALGKNQVSVISVEKMIDQFSLDPTITTPVRDAYVITNEDISAARIKSKFEQSVANKHPAVKIIFINKSSKPIYETGLPGIDAIMQKPKPAELTKTISEIIVSATVQSSVQNYEAPTVTIPEWSPKTESEPEVTPVAPVVETPVVEQPIIEAPIEEPAYEAPVVETRKSQLMEQLENAGKVADISVLVREITASTLIKDIIENNSTYAGIEEKLKSLNDVIFVIMSDPTVSLDEKLSKVRSLLHDKAFYSAKGDTIIEQRLEEVIDCICSRTSALLQSRLDEIDTAIRYSITAKEQENMSPRLAGLNEERANLIIELRKLETDIADIFRSCDMLTMSTATHIAETADNLTGNEKINAMVRARGTSVISEETVNAIRASLELASGKVPSEFSQMKLKVLNMIKLLGKLFDCDQEIIAAQQAVINFLKSQNVEDTVFAETLLKKSLRVYVGEQGVGRTILPYLLSRYKSRQNANVLVLDLTGTAKYTQYGIQYTALDTYLTGLHQKEFMLVAGSLENSVAAAQRIVTTLLKAADYYRVINVILDVDQRELFETIAQDVLSVNFIVDTNISRIERMRDVIERCNVPNVGRRVIINKCDVPIRPIISKLGLDDKIDYQICTVPTVPTIIDAGLNGYNPYGISVVDLTMEEVIRHA